MLSYQTKHHHIMSMLSRMLFNNMGCAGGPPVGNTGEHPGTHVCVYSVDRSPPFKQSVRRPHAVRMIEFSEPSERSCIRCVGCPLCPAPLANALQLSSTLIILWPVSLSRKNTTRTVRPLFQGAISGYQRPSTRD